jgi:hypothetical protein|nr:MAG TPA: hypothetical protein [Caudoviricetes sp.]DAZ53967.1 MAG TPA: hypothetical protein [Caudoviricetes sp.]
MQVLWDSEGEILPGLIFLKKFMKAVQSVLFPRLIGRGSQEKKPSERGDGYET